MVAQVKTLGLTLIAVAALAACGGGGGGTTSTTGGSGLTGSVIDGAIEGADVCLDLNNSLSCDSGEPSAKTQANGSYTLDTAGLTAAQIKNAHIFVSVPTTAKDADDGGKTLAQAGKAAFNLMAPAESAIASNGTATGSVVVVSPMTTLVSHEMMLNGTGAETAKGLVKNKLGLASDVDITQNFVGKTDDTNKDLAKKAQVLAATLGEVMKTIVTSQPSTSTKTQMLGALDYLKTNAQAIITAAASAPSGQTPVVAVQTALQTQALQPVVNTLVSNAEAAVNTSPVIGATTTAFDSIVAEGFYNGHCSQSTYNQSLQKSECTKWSLYHTKATEPGKWQSTKYHVTSAGAFTQSVPNPDYSNYILVDGEGWVSKNVNPQTGTFAADSTGLVTVTKQLTATASQSFKIRMTYKDVSGMKLSDIKAAKVRDILQYADSTVASTVFPSGSKIIVETTEGLPEHYGLGYNRPALYNCSTNPCTTTVFNNFTDLVLGYETPSGNATPTNQLGFWMGSGSTYSGPWYFGTFDLESATSTGGQMTVWKSSNGSQPEKLTEKATFTIKTVYGQPVLVINPSSTVLAARAQITGSSIGFEQLFGVRDGKLYSGEYGSAAAHNLESQSGNWNKTAAEAIIKAMGASTLPQ